MKKLPKILQIIILMSGILIMGLAAGDAEIYHGNTRTYVFHRSSCRYFDCPHCTAVFKTRDEALRLGYRPCKVCNP